MLLVLPALTRAQSVSVSGNLKDLGVNNATNAYVQFCLQNYGANIPRVIGTNSIVAPCAPNFNPDSNGNLSGSIQSNDSITAGGVAGNTFYRVCIYSQGSQFRCNNFQINYAQSTTFNLNNATALTVVPPPFLPTILGARSFEFTQSTPLNPWVITHSFGDKNVVVQCYDTSGNWILPQQITETSPSVVTVTWPSAQAGSCLVMNSGNLVLTSAPANAIVSNPTATQTIAGAPLNLSGSAPLNAAGVDTFGSVGSSLPIKGPIPWRDVTAYMKDSLGNPVNCSSTDTSNGANTTGTISLATPTTVTLAAAKDFKNGCGIAILGAGPLPTITTPPSTLSISSVSGNGTTVTITTTANHNIPTGAAGQNEGVVVSGCTGGSGTFNGTFPIASTVDTTHLTYSASGNGTPSSCAATVTFGYAHGVGGSTTYKYQIAAVDGLMGVTAASSQFSVTSANATLNKYNYNQIFWACGNSNCYPSQTPSASPYMWLVYSDKGLGGSLSCIGTAFTNGFSDQGYNYPCPVFAPASPPGAAVAEALSTTISAGGGTTTLTLAASATTAVTSANVYHDESPFLTSCINDSINDQAIPKNQAGSSYGCLIPTGNWYFSTPSGLYTAALSPKTGDIRVRIAGSLVARTMPIFVQGGTIEAVGAGGGGGNFDSGSQVLIDVGTFSGAPSPAAIVGFGGGVKLSGFAVNFPTQDTFWIDGLGGSEVILKNLFMQTGGNLGSGIHIENLVGGEIDHAILNSSASGGQQLIDFDISQYNGGTTCCVNLSNLFTNAHGIGFRAPGGNSGNCNTNLITITNWLQENEDPLDDSMIQVDAGPNASGTTCSPVSVNGVQLTNVSNADIGQQYNNLFGILGTANNSITSPAMFNVAVQNLQVCVNIVNCGANGGGLQNVAALQGPQKSLGGGSTGFATNGGSVALGTLSLVNNTIGSQGLVMMMPAPSGVFVVSTGSGSLAAGTYCMGFTGNDSRPSSPGETNLSNTVCQTVGASSSILLQGNDGWSNGNMLFAYASKNFYYCVVSSGTFCDITQNLAGSPSKKIATLPTGTGGGWQYTFTSTAGATSTTPPANSSAELSWLNFDSNLSPSSCFFCSGSRSDSWPVGFGIVPTANAGYNIFTKLGINVGTNVTIGGNCTMAGAACGPTGIYDLVINGGADPTGAVAADTAIANALTFFSGKPGGTIAVCGKFLMTQTAKILQTNPSIRFWNSCGKSGANIVVNQHGGATFYSTTNSNVPNPTIAPTLVDQSAQGGTWSSTGPWYFKYSYSNGNGETLVSPSTAVTLGATTDSVNWGNGVPFNSGGWAVNMYCSSDNTNFFLQTASNFKSSSGSFGGPPFLYGGPLNNGAHQVNCTTSGSSPASSNTATKGMVLFQLGDYGSSGSLAGGAEFENIAFYDPNNVLAAAYVVANAQRTLCFSCEFDGFSWNGTFTGNAGANPASSGSAQFETGGIGAAHLNSDGTNQTSNFNVLFEPRFENNHLAMLSVASDDTLYGGDCNPGNTNAMCIDFAGGNIRIFGLHEGIANSASISQLNYIRGQNAGTLSGAEWYFKCETLQLVTAKGCVALAYATGNKLDIRPVGGTATATQAAVVFDANSGQNEVTVTNTNTQPCFSDGTTIGKDPAGTNTIFCAKDGTVNVPSELVGTGAVPSLTGTGACATFSTQVGGQWNGTFKCTGTSGAATITITFANTMQNGYNCDAKDETTTADTLTPTVPSSPTTTCTFSAAAVASGDVVRFFAFGF